MSFSWTSPLTVTCDTQTRQLFEEWDAKTTLMSLDGIISCKAITRKIISEQEKMHCNDHRIQFKFKTLQNHMFLKGTDYYYNAINI